MNEKPNRRQFLASGAAVAGTVAFPAIVRGQNLNSEVRVALVGAGGRGRGACNQNLNVTDMPTRLVAIADIEKDNIGSALNELKRHGDKIAVPAENQFLGLDAYTKAIDKCDVLVTATPPGFRPDIYKYAVENGKHVFMEKPVCIDSPGARKIMEASKVADQKGLKCVVGLQRRYQKNYREAIKKVREGAMGKVVGGLVYWNDNRPWVRDRKPTDTELQYQVRNWYHFVWLSGDNICEQHIHNIDIANWILGTDAADATPTQARGFGGRQVHTTNKHGEIYDHHEVEFFYPGNVIINSMCEHLPGTWPSVSERFVGTQGVLLLSPNSSTLLDHDGKVVWRYKGDGDPDPYQVEHQEFYEAIKANKPLNNAHRGATSAFTSTIGRYATYSGKIIKWDEALAWDNSQLPKDMSQGWNTPAPVNPRPDGSYEIAIPGKFNPQTNKNA